jgi:hypothetical protein
MWIGSFLNTAKPTMHTRASSTRACRCRRARLRGASSAPSSARYLWSLIQRHTRTRTNTSRYVFMHARTAMRSAGTRQPCSASAVAAGR